jgi:regulation of enolase protein 1 (concanavalin A-like superfamily)
MGQSVGHARSTKAVSRAVASMENLEGRTLMSTYYVSNQGSDSNSGTSASSPWQTSGKVSGHHFAPGDVVLFQGGQSFGGLNLFNDGGSASNPVIFSSYGNGRATISPGKGRGAWVLNSSGITFENLNFVGSPGSDTYQDGIRIENYASGTMSGVTVDNCTVTGFAEGGIVFGSDSGSDYLSNVRITNCSIYDNVETGILSYSSAENNTNIYIANNTVHDNYGDGTSVCTGSGIMLGGLNGAVVERNIAYHNGAIGGNGGVGIWAFQSNNVNFQYNESYSNRTERGHDGDGFDFDADVSNSVIQYNYAFDNDGTGAQLDQWKNDGEFVNDVVRFNVLVNNARENNYSNLEVWGSVINAYLYNNVIYTTPGSNGYNSAIRVHNSTIAGQYVDGVHFVNNIIDTADNARLLNIPYAETIGAKDLTFTGNVYWTNGGTVTITYGNKTLNSLTAFQAAGQEMWDGTRTGLFADPMFQNASIDATPAASTSTLASAAAGFKLQSDSPALKEAISLASLFGVSNGGVDYYGDTFSGSAATIAGADQSLHGASSSSVVAVTVGATGSGSTGTTTTGSTATTTPTTSLTTTVPVTNVSGLKGYDIGSVGIAGSNSASNGTFTVTASGSDIYNTSDQFRFVETTLTGNGSITAKVPSMNYAETWAKAGVMIRSSLAANAPEVSMMVDPNGAYISLARTSTGAASSYVSAVNQDLSWVKLVRSGSTFNSYVSADGMHWTLVRTVTMNMSSSVLIGLAVTSQTNNATEKATFSNVSITTG